MNKFKLLICLLLISSGLRAQTRQIQGTVVSSDDGQPLIGVTVLIEGTTQGTSSNADGSWQLAVPDNGNPVKLSFSYIGYETQVHTVAAGQTMLNVRLSASSLELEEVVAIGYGVMRKSDVTGAVASITPEQLQKTPAAGLDQALQGRAAGVTINASSGQPGASAEVRIRGIGTVNDSSPIYVVDGVITDDISFVNPQDIASTEILKDASATAIYGSRGANGVIIVTTKSGKAGSKINIDFNAYVGIQNRWNKLDLMGRDEFAQTIINLEGTQSQIDYFNKNGFNSWLSAYRLGSSSYYPVVKSASNPDGLDYSSIETDWQDEVFKPNAIIQNYHISASGGSDKSTYALSASYFTQEGTIIGSDFERLTLRSNTSYQLTKWLKVGENISFSNSQGRNAMNNNSSPGASILSAALAMAPWDPVRYPEGSVNNLGEDLSGRIAASSNFKNVTNPLSMVEHTHPLDKDERWVGNVYLDIEPIKGLRLHSEVSMDLTNTMSRTFKDQYEYSSYDKNEKNFISRSMSRAQTMRYENTLTYMHDWGKHSLTAMVGQTTEEYNYYYIGGSGASIANPTDNNWYLNQATEDRTEAGDSAARTRMFSMLGRLHYSYDNRYLITVNFRADASSKFPENLWGYFPSTAVAWRINEEPWLRNSDILNNLKLRLGWGQIGNQNITNYVDRSLLSLSTQYGALFGARENETLYQGIAVSRLGNPDIKWETTESLNIGLDASFFNTRMVFSFEYYYKTTKDMLLAAPMPIYMGYASNTYTNIGEANNRGIEMNLEWRDKTESGFEYNVGVNMSTIRNRMTKLNGGTPISDGPFRNGSMYLTYTNEGMPIGAFWGYKTDGLIQTQEQLNAVKRADFQPNAELGDVLFVDTNGDGKLDSSDRCMIGNPIPDIIYGINMGMAWKGFDLNLQFGGTIGNQIFNAMRYYTYFPNDITNKDRALMNYWTPNNTNTDIPRLTATDVNDNDRFSDMYVENGTYFRLRNAQLGYTLPASLTQRIKLQKVRFYVSGQNLFTISSYSGMDPEVGQSSSLSRGIDYGIYPQNISFTGGINVTF